MNQLTKAYPYFDDYDSSKGYHKILFHPAKPIQARELTQIQSILQEQIKKNGDHMFQNGTVVIPGHIFYDSDAKYLKIETVYNNVNVNEHLYNLIGKEIVGDSDYVKAVVVHATVETENDPVTLFIKYTSSGVTSAKTFNAGETLTCHDIAGLTIAISAVDDYTGESAICTINDGVYYVNGYFVEVLKQTIAVTKYSKYASATIGLEYQETIVTENEDETLYDNALGFTNYGAPGAHRLKISLTLVAKRLDYFDESDSELKFIDLLKVDYGRIQYLKNNTKYAEIEKWLAKRTYDESGNYVVKPFSYSASEYRNNKRGSWAASTPYLVNDVVTTSTGSYVALNTGYSASSGPTHTLGVASDGYINWLYVEDVGEWGNGGKVEVNDATLAAHQVAADSFMLTVSPGKAYISGFEVDIPSSISTYVPKAREVTQVENTQIYAPAGSYIVVKRVRGMPKLDDDLTLVNLQDAAGATIGTARVRNIEFQDGSLTDVDNMKFRLFVFDVKMQTGKSFSAHVALISSANFSASVSLDAVQMLGSISTTDASATITGVGTNFVLQLVEGDMILVNNVWKIVQTISSPTSLITTTVNTGTVAGIPYYRGSAILNQGGPYIKHLDVKLKTIRDKNGDIDTSYVINKTFQITTSGTSHVITLTGGETFLPPSDHYVTLSSGTLDNNSVVSTAAFSLNIDATQLTITGLTTATTYAVNAQVKRTGAYSREKTKTVLSKTIIVNNAGVYAADNTTLLSNAWTIASREIGLTEADVVRISKVTMSGHASDMVTYSATNESNITSWFTLDDGQRDEYYDLGKLICRKIPTRPIKVTFEYFDHSDGDYFSVDSYTNVPSKMIKSFVSKTGEVLYLPDCLDFRSRISDNGTEFKISTGGSVSEPISSESTIDTSYSVFKPRVDTLVLSQEGKIIYNIGTKAKDGMPIAGVDVLAYTDNAVNDITFTDLQIKNFTMYDMNRLESRLSNVEYYVSLSMLERSAMTTSVKDEFGLEKDKHGYFIDSFSGHNIGEVGNRDYNCSIDFVNYELRSICTKENAQLIETYNTTAASRISNNYMVTGNMATLPYSEVEVVSQLMASQGEYIQAYLSMSFYGALNVYPASDTWHDTEIRVVTETQYRTETQNVVIDVVKEVINPEYRPPATPPAPTPDPGPVWVQFGEKNATQGILRINGEEVPMTAGEIAYCNAANAKGGFSKEVWDATIKEYVDTVISGLSQGVDYRLK